MKLKETGYNNEETGCCARLNPSDWDGKTLEWQDKTFVKDHVRSLFHMPINFGTVIGRMVQGLDAQEAYGSPYLALSDEVSSWGSDLYIATDREVVGLENVTLSGTFLAKVFEGPYGSMKKWITEMEAYV